MMEKIEKVIEVVNARALNYWKEAAKFFEIYRNDLEVGSLNYGAYSAGRLNQWKAEEADEIRAILLGKLAKNDRDPILMKVNDKMSDFNFNSQMRELYGYHPNFINITKDTGKADLFNQEMLRRIFEGIH